MTLFKKLILFKILLFIGWSPLIAQNFTLSGTIKDSANGEDLIGAGVFAKQLSIGAVANVYGFYSLSLPQGKHLLKISSIGYKQINLEVEITANKTLNFQLSPITKNVAEATITATSGRQQVDKTQMGKVEISIEKIKQLPVLFGEVDILKTIQLLPGVQSGSEGTTGFYVRGGGPDQNLILLDEATVYNANHLFGLFSVFNGDAVKNVELYKGGYPAKFGGRLSSVVDVKLKEGNAKKYKVTGGLGLIASRLTIEGPIKKDTGSFLISGRRTYFDVFTEAINKSNENNSGYTPIPRYFFFDLNLKANYILTKKDRVFLSGYFGRDVFGFKRGILDFGFNWGNGTGVARWNHVFKEKLFLNTSLVYSDYQYSVSNNSALFSFNLGSNIRDWQLKQDYGAKIGARHDVSFGWAATYHNFIIGRIEIGSGTAGAGTNFNNTIEQFGTDFNGYAADDWEINPKIKINYGFRASGFYNKGYTHFVPEPRTAIRYKVSDVFSFKASYTRMAQYVHLVSNSGTSLPTDVWYPTTAKVKPQIADQVSAGTTFLLFGEKLTITDEVYYKKLQNQVDFKNGARLFFNPKLEDEFVFGRGWSYGNEVFIEKKEGKLTGWIGYTLAYTFRRFKYDEFSPEVTIKPKYDIRHDFKVVASYQLAPRIILSAVFVYNSGALTTLPTGYGILQDVGNAGVKVTDIYTTRSNYRLPAYHRMDLGMVYKFRPSLKHPEREKDLTFSIYNVYNRRNAFFLYTEANYTNFSGSNLGLPSGFQAKQVSLFPIIPSITYNFKF